nr:MAG TPA: hypothetical protein [Caudoviricetes sp.]
MEQSVQLRQKFLIQSYHTFITMLSNRAKNDNNKSSP